ncbi:acetate kinase [bacterium]|nr:acetate kinase [bacterium]
MKLLTLNCGSSSVKYIVYDYDKKVAIANGVVERVTISNSFIKHTAYGKDSIRIDSDCPTHREAIKLIRDTLIHPDYGVITEMSEIDAVGHRVVHGGEKFTKSVKIDQEVLGAFKDLQDLAPLHNPPNIQGIEAAMELLPSVTHIAVMDTAFHQTMPPKSYIYAVPYEWYTKYKIRRYGFHGTSHLYVSRRAAVLLGKGADEVNLVTCHIGNGVSLTAIKNGQSYDHSMGFTPLEGLVMGTRSGDLDPAIVEYVAEAEGLSAKQVVSILNKKSGLLGITEKYADRRDIEIAMEKGDERAYLSFDIEAQRLKKYIGAYAAELGGLDAIVFTAGVGEKSVLLRAAVLEGLEFMGVKYDPQKNELATTRYAECDISHSSSKVKILVIPTDEERVFIEDMVAILENRYDIHTRFTYRFQNKGFINTLREELYKKECMENPGLSQVRAKIPE